MNINYKSRNLEITEAMKEYCEKRLNKFDKLIGPETAVVTMSSIRDRPPGSHYPLSWDGHSWRGRRL